MNRVPEKCQKCGRKVPFITLSGNLGLGALKCISGMLSGSVGLTVDGFHSLSDSIGTMFILASLGIAEKPRDASHPYGHGKVEFMASAAVFTVLIGVGVVFFVKSTSVLLEGRHTAPDMLGFLVALVSIVANYVMCNYNLCAGRRLNSPALTANGYENLVDLVSSIPVGFGILAAQFGYFFLDALAGVVVSLFIMGNASREAWHSVNALMDQAAPVATRKKIHAMASSVDGVLAADHIRTRQIGRNLWIDLDILVSPRCSVEAATRIADEVRRVLLRKAQHVEDVVVYYCASWQRPKPA